MSIGRVTAGLVAACLLGAAPAQADVLLGSGGIPGRSSVSEPSRCKYSRTAGPNSWLEVATAPPVAVGANLRRGRRDYTRVRYAVWLSDAERDYATVARSGWSGWIRVHDGQARTWTGVTSFTAAWYGVYSLDVRIEWWRSGRLRGWRAHRIGSYQFFNQFNVGPLGPFGRCANYIAPN